MPLSTLLSPGTAAAVSGDTALADGAAATLILRGQGNLTLEVRDTTGAYATMGEVDSNEPVKQVFGPMTFRARREGVVASWAPAGQAGVAEPVGLDMDKA